MVVVPNTAFDPLIDASGAPEFAGITGQSVPSVLGVDYMLAQRDGPRTRAWIDILRERGLEIVGLHDSDAVLARCETPCPIAGTGPIDLPEVRWMGAYLPAYKLAWVLAPGADIERFDVGEVGSPEYVLLATLHRQEQPGEYIADVQAGLPCALEVSGDVVVTDPLGIANALLVRVPGSCLTVARDFMAKMEPVQSLALTGTWVPALSDDCWVLQTGRPPAGVYDFDVQAKLFRHGVTGKGEVVVVPDAAFENDACYFRYGPLLSDVTLQPSTMLTAPGEPYSTPGPWYQPLNKVVAQYLLPTGNPSAPEAQTVRAGSHGTSCAAVAVGDDMAFLAARAGVEIDDPLRDESSLMVVGDVTLNIDHRQPSDGVAPGAQLIFQVITGRDPDVFGTPSLTMSDAVVQAYQTQPGARVLSFSGQGPEGVGYHAPAQRADHVSWRHRDFLGVAAAGNSGSDTRTGNPTIDDFVEAKNWFGVGGTAPVQSGQIPLELMHQSLTPPTHPCVMPTSSYGPGAGVRVKPDLVVPGAWIDIPHGSGTEETGDGTAPDECDPPSCKSGTSFAAPAVAGLSALVRQYFVDGYYPSGAPSAAHGLNPTSALVRAMLINSTRTLDGNHTGDFGAQGGTRPTFGQGWGLPVLDDALYFSGDPTNAGERSRLVVLNDVPNGFTGAFRTTDRRDTTVDGFRPAMRDDGAVSSRLHEFPLHVAGGEPLHVTLSWTDPTSEPTFGDKNVFLLANDLDLEIVDPAGKVWRPFLGDDGGTPASGVLDTARRLWEGGSSKLGSSTCPSACACSGQPEQDVPQDPSAICDFVGRDRANTIENVFIPAASVMTGTYTLRVFAYDIDGAAFPPAGVQVWPNYASGDGSEETDTITDLDQGYALVASGRVTGQRAVLHLDAASYWCDASGRFQVGITVRGTGLVDPVEVTLRTDEGDCEVVVLTQVPGEPAFSGSIWVEDIAVSSLLPSCTASDGTLLVGASGTFSAASGQAVAFARARCRDAVVREPTVTVTDACDVVGAPGALNRQAISRIAFWVENVHGIPVEDTWFRVRPNRADVSILGEGGVLDTLPGPAGATLQGSFVAYLHDDGLPCEPAPASFEIEVMGAGGFRARSFIEAPIDCGAVGTILETDLPGEVPNTSLRVTKTQVHEVVLDFQSATAATRHNVWRGSIAALQRATYDHLITATVGACNSPSASIVLPNEAVNIGAWYYLVSGESSCVGASPIALEGTTGRARIERGAPPPLQVEAVPDVRRPLGWLDPATGCEP